MKCKSDGGENILGFINGFLIETFYWIIQIQGLKLLANDTCCTSPKHTHANTHTKRGTNHSCMPLNPKPFVYKRLICKSTLASLNYNAKSIPINSTYPKQAVVR